MSRTTVRYKDGKKFRIDAVLRATDPDNPTDPNDPNNRDGLKVGTVNAQYNKQTYGLDFKRGTATLDPDLWSGDKDHNGRTPDEILTGIQSDFPDMHVEEYGSRTMVTAPDLSRLRDENGNLKRKKNESED